MSFDPRERTGSMPYSGTRAEIDAGLRDFMRGVYNHMSIGLLISATVAWVVSNTPLVLTLIESPILMLAIAFSPLVIVWFGLNPRSIMRSSTGKVLGTFWLLCTLMGLSFSTVFLVVAAESLARVFFVTAAMFAGASLYGYTTKKPLDNMHGFLMMGLIGLIVAMVVNMFLQSEMMMFVYSGVGVVLFTIMTAYDTQMIKEAYHYAGRGSEAEKKLAIYGAFSLYWSFIMLFQFLLNLMSQR